MATRFSIYDVLDNEWQLRFQEAGKKYAVFCVDPLSNFPTPFGRGTYWAKTDNVNKVMRYKRLLLQARQDPYSMKWEDIEELQKLYGYFIDMCIKNSGEYATSRYLF